VPAALRSVLRAVASCLVICSWLAISNHCALAALSAPPRATESCPMHSKPAQPKNESGSVCCQILRAQPAPAVVKADAPSAEWLAAGFDFAVAVVGGVETRAPLPLALDTGPPRLVSFAASVLQRSLRAHAPPSLG
jgi:hypothetical protein